MSIQRYRALFLSDLHLGAPSCQADKVLDFLSRVEADVIYLAGDIVDFWALGRRQSWPEPHVRVLRELVQRAKAGTPMHYLVGNHDEEVERLAGRQLGPVTFSRERIHTTCEGRRFLVVHGDEFDLTLKLGPRICHLAARIYDGLILFDRHMQRRGRMARVPASFLASCPKRAVKSASMVVGQFSSWLLAKAAQMGADGVICGHIHRPARTIVRGRLEYVNCGDWIENCTAGVETMDGDIEVIHWDGFMRHLPMRVRRGLRWRTIPATRGAGVAGD